MSNIDKQALRQTAEKAQEHGVFNMDIHSQTVLALLDEMEAKDKQIAELEVKLETADKLSSDHEAYRDSSTHVAVYTTPPAPVSVPAAMEMDDDFDSAFEHGKAVGWNAYRAAMLQSFGNSEQLNSPVIPDGWVILPADPTQAMMNAWLSEVANWRGHASGYRAMIAAAPKPEA